MSFTSRHHLAHAPCFPNHLLPADGIGGSLLCQAGSMALAGLMGSSTNGSLLLRGLRDKTSWFHAFIAMARSRGRLLVKWGVV
jgi:hypothetical protein